MPRMKGAAEGRLELVEGKFQLTAITLSSAIMLPVNADVAKAKKLIEKAEGELSDF